jgi:hypothetical protein
MKANELRIGNWVKCIMDGGITIETDVTHLPNGVWSPYDIGTHITDDTFISEDFEVDPIPLTEEWLVKMGFIEIDGNDYYRFFDLGDFRVFLHKKNSSCFIHYNQHTVDYLTNNIHVHQLQNLYFALTGEELTIKTIDQ